MLNGGLGGEEKAEDVEVELTVEVLGGDGVERREFEDAGVVDEDVDLAELLDGGGDESVDLILFGDVGADGDGLAAGAGNALYDRVRAGPWSWRS